MELLFILFILFFIIRIVYLSVHKNTKILSAKKAKTIIVIGSGGHTTEMIRHVSELNPEFYQPRLYLMAGSDTTSMNKITKVEEDFKEILNTSYRVSKIPRSREVGQSYISSVFTTLLSTLICLPIIFSFKPDLILCNGPGTCIPVCVISFLRNAFLFSSTKIVFVESICRVETLSLTGKILLHIADVVIVQWETLHRKYPQTVFLGRLL